jgi:SOS response regulatory protein OraA/RecX
MSEHVDEVAGAQQALTSAWGRYGHLVAEVRERRSLSFLMRRGFSYDTARKAFSAVVRESAE